MLVALLIASIVFSPLAQSDEAGDENAAPAALYPNIFIATYDGNNVSWLTEGQGPSWSPDGTQMTFYRPGAQYGDGDIFIINTRQRGGGWFASGIEPAWEPDRRWNWIAYTSTEGIDIRQAQAPGAPQRTLVRHDFLAGLPLNKGGTDAPSDKGVGKPSWSPDGMQIAFEHRGDDVVMPAQVFLMDAAGFNLQHLRPIFGTRFAESDPAWSPDGSSIALWTYDHGLTTIRLSDRGVHTVYDDFPTVAYGASPAWSPDGTKIAFVVNGWQPEGRAIWVVDSAGGSPSELIPNAYDPAWSPDGNYIAFVSDLPEPTPLPDFPPVSGAASIYNWQRVHTDLLDASSRYVLFDDGTFELQYAWLDGTFMSYTGTYVRTGSDIVLEFDDYRDVPAIGTFSDGGATLSVEYDIWMVMSDFEDGIYVLAEQTPKGPVKEPDEPQDPPGKLPDTPPGGQKKPPPGELPDPPQLRIPK